MEKAPTQKGIKITIIIMCLIIIVIGKIFVIHEYSVEEIDINTDDFSVDGFTYHIDTCMSDPDKTISGWVIKDSEQINSNAIKVVLIDIETDNKYVLPTQIEIREDVTEHLNDGNNYDYSGFKVHLDKCVDFEFENAYLLAFIINENGNKYYYNTQKIIRNM